MRLKHLILATASVVAATPALAHSGVHSMSGFAAGFMHPLGGFDHMLAMLGVGLFAALLGRRALIVVPSSFVLMMMAGGVIGMAGFDVPAAEESIAASVIALGAVVALGRSWPLSAAAMLMGFFALFRGYAHGIEIPSGANALSYSVGFGLASAALHTLGILLGQIAMGRERASQSLGAAITLAGFVLIFG